MPCGCSKQQHGYRAKSCGVVKSNLATSFNVAKHTSKHKELQLFVNPEAAAMRAYSMGKLIEDAGRKDER